MLAYFTFTKMVEVAPDVSEANELCRYMQTAYLTIEKRIKIDSN